MSQVGTSLGSVRNANTKSDDTTMSVQIVARENQDILNHCTKYLARDGGGPRHNFGQYDPNDLRVRVCEAWRFPLIDGHSEGQDYVRNYGLNDVTFVYWTASRPSPPDQVGVVGTFGNLYDPIPLQPLKFVDADTPFLAVTVVVPKGEVHTYKFIVDGEPVADPINPQLRVMDNGRVWSRFFTENCTQPISFEGWECVLLQRLTDHILPFRTEEGQRALQQNLVTKTFLLDESVGAVNFIDKLVAREENHHFDDYKTCLELIDRVLRQRNPFQEPPVMPKQMFVDLYNQMAQNNVPGWDYGQYGNPRFFLQLCAGTHSLARSAIRNTEATRREQVGLISRKSSATPRAERCLTGALRNGTPAGRRSRISRVKKRGSACVTSLMS